VFWSFETGGPPAGWGVRRTNFGNSNMFRISIFGFRISDILFLVLSVILANLCEPLPWKVELYYDARLPRSSNSWGGGGCH
jgi:hypothetical protein